MFSFFLLADCNKLFIINDFITKQERTKHLDPAEVVAHENDNMLPPGFKKVGHNGNHK